MIPLNVQNILLLALLVLLCESGRSVGTPAELVDALQKAPEDRTLEEWALFDKKNLQLIAAGGSLSTAGSRDELANRLFDFYNGADASTSGTRRRRNEGISTDDARSEDARRNEASATDARDKGARRQIDGNSTEEAQREAVGVGAVKRTRVNARKRAANPDQHPTVSNARTDSRAPRHSKTSRQAGASPAAVPNENISHPFNPDQEAEMRRMFSAYLAELLQNNLRPTDSAELSDVEEVQPVRREPSWNVPPDAVDRSFGSSSRHLRSQREAATSREAENRRAFPLGNIGLNAANIPPAPESVIRKIRQGEFVHLDHLLPGAATSGDNYTITFEADETTPGTPALRVEPRRANGRKITDFMGWISAWNSYLRIYLFYFPDRAQEMLFYQASIAQLASYYSFAIWSQYDRAFRMHVAMSPAGRWDVFNEELFNRHIRFSNRSIGNTRASGSHRRATDRTCFTCQQPGHFSSACPIRSQLAPAPVTSPTPFNGVQSQSASNPPSASSRSAQPFPAPQRQVVGPRRPPCHYFNGNRCNRSAAQCPFDHRCSLCGGPHGAATCPSRGS